MSAIEPNIAGLDELEVDALTELVNIAVARAAHSLRNLVGEQVFLTVPSLAICSRAEAAELVTERQSVPLVAVRQAFEGIFSGRALLIFPETKSLEFVRAAVGRQLSLEDVVELEQEALAEIGNIVLNSFMSTIANLLEQSFSMSLPEVIRCLGRDLFGIPPVAEDDIVLFIRINFSFKDREVSGYVAMVMDVRSLASLRSLLSEFIRRTTN